MKRFPWFGFCLGLLAISTGCANTPTSKTPSPILPLRTVRLYETGVGYFERTGEVSMQEGTSLPVPAAHVDDALKTLIVVSGKGRTTVDGLEFDSSVTEGMARALAALPKTQDTEITYLNLLSSLKGESVVVRTPKSTIEGRIINIVVEENPEKPNSSESPPDSDESNSKTPVTQTLRVLILSANKEILNIVASDITSIRPLSSVTQARLDLALNALSTRGSQSRRLIRVMANAQGPVTLGYIAETPLWRTTYRLVLDDTKPEAMLQGWALVHNDTDENWQQVRVELVNGRPDSFLFPMAAPRYGRRPLVTPETDLSTIPQLLDRTPDGIWGDHADIDEYQSYGTGYGYGAGYGSLSGSRRASAPSVRMGATMSQSPPEASERLSVGNLASVRQAEGVESAALFIYSLPRPVDLRAHGSALVPFVQSSVTSPRITWVDSQEAPQMGVLFTNRAGQTLPAGPVAVFSDGGFAGESTLDRLKPHEQRYLLFGVDLDVEAKKKTDAEVHAAQLIVLEKDTLVEHFTTTQDLRFLMENRSGQSRAVHWALSLVDNANVEGADEVRYDKESDKYILVFHVPAHEKAERKVRIIQGFQQKHSLDTITFDRLDSLTTQSTLSASQRNVLDTAKEQQKKLEQTRSLIADMDEAMKRIESDLERFREHLKALGGEKGAGAAANPFVKRILDAEDQLTLLRTKRQTLVDRSHEEQKTIRRTLEPLVAPATSSQP
ncbi:MAG TPA: hypothetical protein PKL24_07385 [Polyangiaceae bacterium]|jgi:hypothetical protein|nr:MAG: hypothetical protein BWY17_03017 [Deltaproteobacteria bacterium ADurb.Bin207]HNZ21948.1 hypothetical protein [Polyangiaceae bacterium]HOD23133.1 hypothetical protein [Polyangiaceae bacterium]HOE50325.1 hypothetical protein [Polyangiaceae bacterium]HOH00569.1 hypothetical protein [Polyangiaceae bacterium]